MDEATAIATIVTNCKREGRPTRESRDDPLTIARSYDFLVKQIGSIAKVARQLKFISADTISNYLALLKLDSKVQKLVKQRLLSFKKAYSLSQLPKHRQTEFSEKIIEHHLNTFDTRKVINYALTYPDKQAAECIDELYKHKPKVTEVHSLLIELSNEALKGLEHLSKRDNLDPQEVIKFIFKQKADIELESSQIKGQFLTISTSKESHIKLQKQAEISSKRVEELISQWIIKKAKWKKVRGIIELKEEGLSQAEISKRLGVSKNYVSACVQVHEIMMEDIIEERRKMEEDREEYRKNTEKAKRLKKKVAELENKEKELLERVRNKEAKIREKASSKEKRARQETHRLRQSLLS